MRSGLRLAGAVCGWLEAGGVATVATLVEVDGSTPLPAGSMMALGPDGQVVGSVAGSCVDSALAQELEQASGPPRVVTYSTGDGPWSVGPACGGRLRVLVERLDPDGLAHWQVIRRELQAHRAVARVTTLDADPGVTGGPVLLRESERPGEPGWSIEPGSGASGRAFEPLVARTSASASATGAPAAELHVLDGRRLAVQVWPRPPRLILVGADAVAASLAELAGSVGYHVTVCDPRPRFTTRARFPTADAVVVGWPQHHLRVEAAGGRLGPDTAVCVLTHDERVDVPTLVAALSAPALGYLAALGSRPTQRRRRRLLAEAGLDPQTVGRLRAPAGLDLRATDPAGTALSVLAELTAVRHGGSARALSDLTGPLHDRTGAGDRAARGCAAPSAGPTPSAGRGSG